ncbi:MAG: CARDB domain-containing protein [Planctomycetota bacterium]|jgi:hypothetical protein
MVNTNLLQAKPGATILKWKAEINISLAPGKVTIIEIKQLEKLDPIWTRTDPAMAQSELKYNSKDKTAEIIIHNIGAEKAENITFALIRRDKIVESKSIPALEAPIDLIPKTVKLNFSNVEPGDKIVIDPEDKIAEIYEGNNFVSIADKK